MVGVGVEWKRIEFIPVTGYFFDSQTLVLPSISFYWWWGRGRGNKAILLTVKKLSFPSSRYFPGSVQVVVLDITL